MIRDFVEEVINQGRLERVDDRVVADKMVESRILMDGLGMMKQFGVIQRL